MTWDSTRTRDQRLETWLRLQQQRLQTWLGLQVKDSWTSLEWTVPCICLSLCHSFYHILYANCILISPGPPTPCHSPRRHNSAYTFYAGWKEQVSHLPSLPHSTGAPLRVCWPDVSLSGTGTAVLLTARPSSGQWTRLQTSSVPLSHPS